MLVLLYVVSGLMIVGGIVVLVWPHLVRRFFEGGWSLLQDAGLARKGSMIYSPTVGGIWMIVIGVALMVILATEGERAIQ